MTIVSGIRSGLRNGLRSGLNPSDGAAWTTDASGWETPLDAAEWASFITANAPAWSVPNSLWDTEVVAGPMVDVIGADDFAAVGAGHLFRQAVAGWDRLAVGTTNVAAQRFERAGFANTATTSVLLLAYVQNLSVPVASAGIVGMGTSTTQYGAVFLAGTTTVRARSTNLADGAANAFGIVNVRPVVIQVDVTNAKTRYFSDTEKLSPAYAACAGSLLTLGPPGGGNSISGRYLYVAAWKGAAAERSEAQIKTLLEALTPLAIGWVAA